MKDITLNQMAVASLRPCPRNARTHSKKQITQIARSIERFGFTNPVLISEFRNLARSFGVGCGL